MENIIVKICTNCNLNNTKRANGKYCQKCITKRNNEKLKEKGYYKDYYKNNQDKFVSTYSKKGLKSETELSKAQLYRRQYYLKQKESLKNNS